MSAEGPTIKVRAGHDRKRLAGRRPVKYTEPESFTSVRGPQHPRSDPKPVKMVSVM